MKKLVFSLLMVIIAIGANAQTNFRNLTYRMHWQLHKQKVNLCSSTSTPPGVVLARQWQETFSHRPRSVPI